VNFSRILNDSTPIAFSYEKALVIRGQKENIERR
jgi:hypothetical protein